MDRLKVLSFDIEIVAFPSERLTEYLYTKQHRDIIDLMMGAEISTVVCIAWKWLGEKKVYSSDIKKHKIVNKTKLGADFHVLRDFAKVASEADVLVGHYSSGFDFPFVQARLLINGLPRLPDIKHFDTCRIAQKKLHLGSNKLDDVAKTLGCKHRKIDKGGWKWWLALANGDTSVIPKMVKYCKMDVVVLEEVFLKLRPMIQNYPVLDKSKCPYCQSAKIAKDGTRITRKGRVQRLKCCDCGGNFQ